MDRIGEGILDKIVLVNKINEAIEKKTFLESQLDQAKAIKATEDINEKMVIDILEIKKTHKFNTIPQISFF